ncbi:uroporphyrinogen-III synthase [Hyperthermus butylicus]|uniref:Uroporphyrinogen-III synthase n=1 Tax=Hyperthermus butylicus (strain DSM 5456 / JCM 9403 / PLM1-5) TaxID=415426 RepID=A2BL24_HYPBU|nr:uroporphyrinogen-III synthase [Hyperthermus butylicus]ABM80685.1 Uroporphyrinogen-III synthase [Hyperthermus butylicus DSM 5456]
MAAKLAGKPTILLLRPPDSQPGPLAEIGYVAHIPIVEVVARSGAVEEVARLLGGCDWIVFTSPRAPRFLAKLLPEIRRLQEQGRLHVAVVGPRTANVLSEAGLRVDLVPGEYRGKAVAEELRRRNPRCVLIPRSAAAEHNDFMLLQSMGVEVRIVHLYTAKPVERLARIAASIADEFDYVVFTSPSIVQTLARHYNGSYKFTAAVIGPTTLAALKESKLARARTIVAEKYTMDGLAEAIRRDWGKRAGL